MKKTILLLLGTLLVLPVLQPISQSLLLVALDPGCDPGWQEGDIIFQMSKSKQSPFITWATKSLYTHCGIIVKKNNQYYVLEASNVVKLTPINDWCNRGRFGMCKTRSVLNRPVKINYKKYLGKKYDLEFSFDNDKYYCSELVYQIYKEQLDTILCKPKKVSDYNLIGLRKTMKKRHINKKQLVVAPCDLLD